MDNLMEIKKIPPPSKKGKGVFAKRNIKKGTKVDIAHILLISNKDYDMIQDTCLYSYIFEWDDPKYNGEYQAAIALSNSQFINHAYEPNIKYLYDYEEQTIIFIAVRDIEKGEELTVNYNGSENNMSPVWFDVES